MISEAHDLLRTTTLLEERSQRAEELLRSTLFLADHLIAASPAAELGAKGGKQTAKKGSEYFRQLAAKRKKHAGGRPKKHSRPN